MFVAFLIRLLRWPDTGLPVRLACGFELGGVVPPSDTLRPIDPTHPGKSKQAERPASRLGQTATQFIDSLEQDKRHPHDILRRFGRHPSKRSATPPPG